MHLGVEIKTLMVRSIRSIGLNKLVIEKNSWSRNNVEQFACIWNIGNLEEVHYEFFGVIYAISEGVSMDLLQLVHNTFTQLE